MQKITINNYSCSSKPSTKSCGCITILSGDCVKYTGLYLENLNVQNGDTFNNALIKINNLINNNGIVTMDSPTIVFQGNGTPNQPLFAQFIGEIPVPVIPTLQEVTDEGNTTTNSINVVNTIGSSDIIAQSDSNSSVITAKSGGNHNVDLYADMGSDQAYISSSSPGGVGILTSNSTSVGLRLMNNGGNEAYINRGTSPTNLVFKSNDIVTNTMFSDGRMSGTNAINSNEFVTLQQLPVQVNADWNATSGPSEILNKPNVILNQSLVAQTSSSAWLSGTFTAATGKFGGGPPNTFVALEVISLPSSLNLAAIFNGRVQGNDAENNNEFITLGQADITYIPLTQKASANGVATLDGTGKIPIAQLPNSIMEYKGVWNASTNTPTLADGSGDIGDVYRVTVAGTQFTPPISFEIGDYAIYNGTKWEKADTSDTVTSVNGQTGLVSLDLQDVTDVGNITSNAIALNELSNNVPISGGGMLLLRHGDGEGFIEEISKPSNTLNPLNINASVINLNGDCLISGASDFDGSIDFKTTVISTGGSFTVDDTHQILMCNNSSNLTLNLPTAVGIIGRQYTIKRLGVGAGTFVNIDPFGSETIDGSTTYLIPLQNDFITIVSDGSNWKILSKPTPTQATPSLQDVTSINNTTDRAIQISNQLALDTTEGLKLLYEPSNSTASIVAKPSTGLPSQIIMFTEESVQGPSIFLSGGTGVVTIQDGLSGAQPVLVAQGRISVSSVLSAAVNPEDVVIFKQIDPLQQAMFLSSANGSGSQTVFNIPHSAVGATMVSVTPNSFDASSRFYATLSGSNVVITYATAPPAGSSNLSWTIIIK